MSLYHSDFQGKQTSPSLRISEEILLRVGQDAVVKQLMHTFPMLILAVLPLVLPSLLRLASLPSLLALRQMVVSRVLQVTTTWLESNLLLVSPLGPEVIQHLIMRYMTDSSSLS